MNCVQPNMANHYQFSLKFEECNVCYHTCHNYFIRFFFQCIAFLTYSLEFQLIVLHIVAFSKNVSIPFKNNYSISSYWVLCRVALTSGGCMWGSGVTTLPMIFSEISTQSLLVISINMCPYLSTFLWLSLTAMLCFLPGP